MATKKKVGDRRSGPPAEVAVKAAKAEPGKPSLEQVEAKERAVVEKFVSLMHEIGISKESTDAFADANARSTKKFDLEKRLASAQKTKRWVRKLQKKIDKAKEKEKG